MITKFEKETIEIKNEIEEKKIDEVAELEATHIHYCGHDTDPPTACKRVKIK
jgi:hypothetical protein